MKLKILAATLLLALPAASAEPPVPQLRIEPTTGGSIFYVKNVSSQPLTGFLIELVDYPGSSYALWQDEIGAEAIAPGAPGPIAPDREKRIQVGNMTVGAVPDYVKIQAAVYADGTTAGIPEKITQLIERRRFTLETVRQTIHRLEKAQEAKLSKDAMVADLKHAIEFMQPRGGPPAVQIGLNRTAGSKVLSNAAAQLAKQSVDETLAGLRAWESALEASKPVIGDQ
jgi:hypothetical protein